MSGKHDGRPRVVVLALDGATFDLIDPWVAEAKLPHLGGLLARGVRARLRSTMPPITPCAWTSFSTAQDPGRHGIFDFQQVKTGTYDLLSTNGSHRRVRTIWEYLNSQGLTVGLYNLPWMYPPPALEGYVVCGFDAPDINRNAVHPPELSDELRAAVPEISLAAQFLKRVGGRYDLEALRRQIRVNIEAAKLLLERRPVDVCVLTFMLLDQVAHFFLHPDPTRRGAGDLPDVVLAVHQWLDEGLGEILSGLPEETMVVGVSDHGVGPTRVRVNIARALADAGLLAYRADAPGVRPVAGRPCGPLAAAKRALSKVVPAGAWLKLREARQRARSRGLFSAIDWGRTRAFSWGNFAQVRLNLQGREPQGIVTAEERPAVIAEVKRVLLDIRDPQTNEPLFAQALTPEELYSGPNTEGAADVLGVPSDWGVEASMHLAAAGAPLIIDDATAAAVNPNMGEKVAGHTPEGIFFAAGGVFRRGRALPEAGICDVGPTLLHALGLALPQDVDGRPVRQAFDGEYLAENPPRYAEERLGEPAGAQGGAYTAEEAEEVEARLRELGYM